MIDKTISFLQTQLAAYLNTEYQLTTDKVTISGIIKQNGNTDSDLPVDGVALMLTGVEEEHACQPTQQYVDRDSTRYRTAPALLLNLQVLVLLNFTHHDEALKILSGVLQFFQAKPVFDADNTMAFALLGIEKLRVKLISQTLEQRNHLWATLGAKYMPSLLYKASLIQLEEQRVTQQIPTIQEVNHQLHKN